MPLYGIIVPFSSRFTASTRLNVKILLTLMEFACLRYTGRCADTRVDAAAVGVQTFGTFQPFFSHFSRSKQLLVHYYVVAQRCTEYVNDDGKEIK